MKNSFSLFEILISILLSATIFIYSSKLLSELYFENKNSLDLELKKINLLTTKAFLEQNKDSLNELKISSNKLFFKSQILLENVKEFKYVVNGDIAKIDINLNNEFIQTWYIKL